MAKVDRTKIELECDVYEKKKSVCVDGKWGSIDEEDNIVVACKHDFVGPFSEGLAWVEQDGKIGWVNDRDQMVIPPFFDYGSNFHDGRAHVIVDNKHGFIDPQGEWVIKPVYEDARRFEGGIAEVEHPDGRVLSIDVNGHVVERKE